MYTSVKSQSILNIHNTKLNKTQTHSTVEWYISSNIRYLFTVSVIHFLHSIQPIKFYSKKKKLAQESLVLWNLVEKYHDNMIGKYSPLPCFTKFGN